MNRWDGQNLVVRHETQKPNEAGTAMDIDVHGEIAAPGEWWLETALAVIDGLLGKPDASGTGYLLGPHDADPDMVGTLVAERLRQRRERATPSS